MAQVLKRRSLVNSGRRRRRVKVARRRNGPRKMSARQIKFFGTARQKAALRASRGRKRRTSNAGKNSIRKTKKRLQKTPGKDASTWFGASMKRNKKRKTRRKNVGQVFSIGLAGLLGGNPGRKKRRTTKRRVKKMARRRRRSNAGKRVVRRRRRAVAVVHRRRRRRTANVGGSYRRRRRRVNRSYGHSRRRRRNVGGGAISSTTGMLKNALGVIGGAVAARYTTQLALGAKNTGPIGYIGNAVAALVLGWAAKKFLKSPQLGVMVTLGGFTGLALRMLNDLTPIGQYVNLQLAGGGKVGDTGIGLITDSYFVVPTVFQNGSMTQAQIPDQLTQMMAAGSVRSGGVGAYRRRRAA